uniref:Uncharacterized protein n=1 Tax=Tetranychus urticae TaxID=32264 RepID=T1KIP0_TETUR
MRIAIQMISTRNPAFHHQVTINLSTAKVKQIV